jgi:hypothetical protein
MPGGADCCYRRPANPHDILRMKAVEELVAWLVNEIQQVHCLQGVAMSVLRIVLIATWMAFAPLTVLTGLHV